MATNRGRPRNMDKAGDKADFKQYVITIIIFDAKNEQ